MFFLCAVVSYRRNGPIDLIFFYSFRLEMKMMQIYFDGVVVPLSNKFKFLKTKVEVGKLKKNDEKRLFLRERLVLLGHL